MADTLLRSVVAGESVVGGDIVDDINPSRPTDTVARVELASVATAEAAMAVSRAAFEAWRETPAPARGDVLRAAAEILELSVTDVGRDLAREEGKPLSEAVAETKRAVAILRYFAAQTLEPDGDTYPSHSERTFLFARREPIGVVTVITPWNFPIAIPTWKIAPALAFGNTVCWKPAEIVPLTSIHLYNALATAGLPRGVLNILLGRGSTLGDTIVSAADAVSFTGSNSVGRKVQQRAIAASVKVQLELGGKNPAVVLNDADLDVAVEQVARGAYLSAGQKCTATSRVIVCDRIADEFTERLAVTADAWTVGDALAPETKVGPVASEAQMRTVEGFLAEARADRGTFVTRRDAAEADEGYFVRPTVITHLPESSRVVREEIFGPVVTISVVSGLDEAIAAANDTPFGLTAALFTTNLANAFQFAREVRAGIVKINQESAGIEFHVPFGGLKASSSGSPEQGKVARDFFTEWKTVYLDA